MKLIAFLLCLIAAFYLVIVEINYWYYREVNTPIGKLLRFLAFSVLILGWIVLLIIILIG